MAETATEVRSAAAVDDKIEELWREYKATGDTEAKNGLLMHYIKLVKWIVRRMMPKYNNYNEYDDLINCGVIGLIDAVDKFKPEQGVKFETYASARISGEILDYMRSQDWAPPSLRKKINAVMRAYESLETQTHSAPNEQAVADLLGVPLSQVQKILMQTHMFNVINFEDTLTASHAATELAAPDETMPENMLMTKETKAILADIIDALPEKERLVVTLYYYEGFLLKDIAEILNVSESRVSQIHSRVLVKMRSKLQKLI